MNEERCWPFMVGDGGLYTENSFGELFIHTEVFRNATNYHENLRRRLLYVKNFAKIGSAFWKKGGVTLHWLALRSEYNHLEVSLV